MQFELEAIYQHAPIGLGVLDKELRFLRINDRLAEMNGLPVQAHLGRTVPELLPSVAAQARTVVDQVLASGQPLLNVEVRGETPARPGVERIWIEHFSPIRDEAGAVAGVSVAVQEVTEQRRMQAQLAQSEQRLGFALEAADLVTWEWDLASDRIVVSQRGLLGYAASQLPTHMQSVEGLIHPDDQPRVREALARHLDGQSPGYDCDYRMRAADGSWRWVTSRGRVTRRGDHDEPLAMSGVQRDITVHKQAQLDVQEQAQLLQLAFDAIMVWSERGGIERWNRGAERQYGYTSQEAIGRVSHELLDTRFDDPVESVQQSVRAQGIWRGEMSHRRKDGRRLRVQAVIQRVGASERVLEITRDVTREREATQQLARGEQALRRSQERLTLALEAARMGVWEWSPGQDFLQWSTQMFQLCGLPPSADGRQDLRAFLATVHPQDREAVQAQLDKAARHAGGFELEFRVHPPRGGERWLMARGRPVDHGDGGPMLLGVTLDLTRHKAMEHALRDADRRKDDFIAMLAHELRNPLAPLRSAIEVLRRLAPPDARVERNQDVIARQVRHMARLVDDLLDVSRMARGRLALQLQPCDLGEIAVQAAEDYRGNLEAAGLRLTVYPPATPMVVRGDPVRLAQMMGNLLTNAGRFNQAGGAIEVSAGLHGDGHTAQVDVVDTGIGIEPHMIESLFDPFTQAAQDASRSRGGLGLGLAVTRGLARLHGGEVSAHSAGLGQGARFCLRIPLQRDAE